MSENDKSIVFSLVCNRSRRKELGRVAGSFGAQLFSESQPVFRKLSESEKQIVGQLMGGRVRDNDLLSRLQQEVDKRGLAVSPIQRVSESRLDSFQQLLADRNQTIWFER